MTDVPDVSEIGLSPDDRARLVATVMRRVRERPSQASTLVAALCSWMRPVGISAAAAAIAGLVAISTSARSVAPVEATAENAQSFERWIQTGERPSAAEVMAVLVAGEANDPRD